MYEFKSKHRENVLHWIPNSTLLKKTKIIKYLFNLHDVVIHCINECCLLGDVIKQITIFCLNSRFVNPS